MSSPASRRSKRSSAAGTPARSRASQQPPSSPSAAGPASQNTPKAPRSNVAASSPPIFFQSSPANGSIRDRVDAGLSSPLRQASSIADNDLTPRGNHNRPPNGMASQELSKVLLMILAYRVISYTICFKLESHPCRCIYFTTFGYTNKQQWRAIRTLLSIYGSWCFGSEQLQKR